MMFWNESRTKAFPYYTDDMPCSEMVCERKERNLIIMVISYPFSDVNLLR